MLTQDENAALVFDFDGVLADTEPLHWMTWAEVLARYGIEFSWVEYGRIGCGVDDAQIWATFADRVPVLNADAWARLTEERNQMVLARSLEKNPIALETVELLNSLGAHRLGMVTNSRRVEVEPVLRAAGLYERFEALVFREDVEAPKPAPDPYLRAAARLGVTTGIAFEDSATGFASALAAGFQPVRVPCPGDLVEIVKRYVGNSAVP